MPDRSLLERISAALAPDARITVMTGAGVSAASGVPTFRGAEGLWKAFRVEDLATPEAFARDPRRVWEWYDGRRATIAGCEPNPAHHVLASWSLRFPRFTLITQNVDGLHERAGAADVLRLHGSIWEVGCWHECGAAPHRWRDDTVPLPVLPPPCPHCGGPLRPGVVWFGEVLDADVVDRCLEATRCDVFFTIGTSAMVYPAAGFLDQARGHGAMTVEINPEATPASSSVDAVLAERAEVALTSIDSALGPHPLALATPRLRMEPLLPKDVEAAHALWTDPEVRRYLWDDRMIPRETAEEVTRASAHDFAARRFGLWLLFARDVPGSPAGFCGLRSAGVGNEPELLFGLHPDYWRRGLAQEASRAVLDYAFTTLRLPRVIAATDAPNERSARTLAALGMRFDRRAEHKGLDTLFYGIEPGPPPRGGTK
jgi:NAD-dependent deacetylase